MAKKKPKKQKVASKKAVRRKAKKKPQLAASGLSLQQRKRVNRKHVLEALHAETGVRADEVAAARVEAYCADPIGADEGEFFFAGSLKLRRWYVDPSKPNDAERAGLWAAVRTRMEKPVSPVPTGWDGDTFVMTLQAMAEEIG